MDQLKQILKQAIKYRFWITVALATILPGVAYVLGSGAIKKKTEEQTNAILGAEKGVKQYASGVLPNHQYKGIVDEKTTVLTQDVNASWKKLYARQAPLLNWPKSVEERFTAWGRKWPEKVDPNVVQLAIVDYVDAYPRAVTEVYKTFDPFDPIEGTGVVAAPSEAILLKPAPFKPDAPPELGKVWAAQERLWIQKTLLQVIAEVNKGAKSWDTAVIKQVNAIEVGNAEAQDQVSLGKGETLVEAEAIVAPGAAAPASAESTSSGAMPGMPTPGGGLEEEVQNVLYIKSDSTQYKILPVQMSVLIDQNRIQDLLVALENSPMAIQVAEFEMSKPGTRVKKPEKGEGLDFGGMGMYAYSGRMGGMGMMPPGMPRMSAFGGMMTQMPSAMASYYSMGSTGAPGKKGVDKRAVDRAKQKQEELKKARQTKTYSIHDPYYYIVEVMVYGQARFYNPPPAEAPGQPSEAAPATAEATAKAEAPAPATEAPKTETPTAEAQKTETEPAKTKEEAAKKEEPPTGKEEPAKKEATPPAKEEAAKKEEPTPAKEEAAKESTPKKEEAPKAKEGDTPAAKTATETTPKK